MPYNQQGRWESPYPTHGSNQSPTYGAKTSGGGSAGGGNSGSALAGFGMVMSIGGMVVSAIGSYYGAKSAKLQARSQAMSLEFDGTMADLNARAAEQDAQAILRAGQYDAARMSAEAGAAIAEGRVAQAAGGLQAGVGSAAETAVSAEMVKRIDAMTINLNATRQANAARTRATDFRNRGLLSRTAAASVRRMGASISPAAAVTGSLVGGAGSAGTSVANYYGRN